MKPGNSWDLRATSELQGVNMRCAHAHIYWEPGKFENIKDKEIVDNVNGAQVAIKTQNAKFFETANNKVKFRIVLSHHPHHSSGPGNRFSPWWYPHRWEYPWYQACWRSWQGAPRVALVGLPCRYNVQLGLLIYRLSSEWPNAIYSVANVRSYNAWCYRWSRVGLNSVLEKKPGYGRSLRISEFHQYKLAAWISGR